jgi:hypothetical protein
VFFGFAQRNHLRTDDGARGYLEAVVIRASHDSIVVRLFGLFFRTAVGVASVPRSGVTRIAAAQ